MIHLIQAHPLYAGIGVYFLFSNLIGAMSAPTDKSGGFYRYVYRFSHGLAGNVKYALQAKFPEYLEKPADPQG